MSSDATARKTGTQPSPLGATEFHISDWPMQCLSAVVREHNQKASRLLRRHNMDYKIWRLLAGLHEQEPLTVGQLAELAVLDRANVSKMIGQMEKQALVERRDPAEDRRQSLLALTERGRAMYRRVEPQMLLLFRQYFADYQPEEFRRLMSLAENLLSRVRAADT